MTIDERKKEKEWRKLKEISQSLMEEKAIFQSVLFGISIATTNGSQKERQIELLNALQKFNITVGDTEVHITAPVFFSKTFEITFGWKVVNCDCTRENASSYTISNIILLLRDMIEKINSIEKEILPGEPTSIKNDGAAKPILSAIYNFETAFLLAIR